MNEATKKILTNRDLIAINQDIEGRSPYYLGSTPETPREYFWMYKMLSNGDIALGVFNFSDKKRGMALQLFDLGLPETTGKCLRAYDCVNGEDFGILPQSVYVHVEAHDCKIFRCKLEDIK